MDLKYVVSHTIFETIIGSTAYGTCIEGVSDIDKAGVMIPGKEYFYGLDKFEQFQGFPGEDHTVYDFRKAITLIHDNNPNLVDLLCAPEHCVLKTSPYWQKIMDNKDLFISKRCRYTFSGYAYAQLARISVHRKYLLNPPKAKPERKDFGLLNESVFPTSQIKAVVHSCLEYIIKEEKESFIKELDALYGDYVIPLFARFVKEDERSIAMEQLQIGIKAQARTLLSLGTKYIKDEYLDQAGKEVKFYEATKDWKQYQEWKKHRNKKRAELEVKYGYDPKHSMHLIRLLRMGEEILRTGEVNVDRRGIDADELKEIRFGSWTFEQVEKYAHEMDAVLGNLYKISTLRKSPDRNKINELCIEISDEYLNNNP